QVLEPRVGMRVNADETRKVADVVLELHRRIPGPHRPRRDRVTHDASRADERVLADLDTRQDRAVRADARATADYATFHAIEIGRALRMRIVGENHVWPEEDVVVDLRELEKATGVNAHARAEPIAELERRVCPDRDVVTDHVVLADRGALPGLEAGADARSGVDRRERPDDRARTDDELELAVFLAAWSASQDRVLADDASLPQTAVLRDDPGRGHRRLGAGAPARPGASRHAARAPPDRSDRMELARSEPREMGVRDRAWAEAELEEHVVLERRLHVARARALDPERLLIEPVEHDRDVVRAEIPQHVYVELVQPEIHALAVD